MPLRLPDPVCAAALAVAFGSPLAAAPAAIGPAKCTSCHDHERQTTQWRTTEPAQGQGKAHVNALKRLDDARAANYAKAIGLGDTYDPRGACVRCHATVFRGVANAGVSCESCHGPAGDYLEPHQQKGAYATAVGLGLRDLRQKPAAIGRLCADCHRLDDRRLAAAGHPDGAAWDVGAGLARIAHWSARYDAALVAAAAGPRRLSGGAPAAVAAGPAAATAGRTAGATPRAAEPWDWSQPVAALPADYVPDPAPSAAAATTPAAATRARPPTAVAPASIAEERPAVPLGRGPAAPAIETAAPGAGPAARPAPVDVAARRGQALRALEALLRRGARAPGLPPPRAPAELGGPDSELLRLQEEALVLALEALRRP